MLWHHSVISFVAVVVLLLTIFGCGDGVNGETDYFPGLRKPPAQLSGNNWNQHDKANLLAQLSNIIEDEARRRFQQKQLQIQQHQLLKQQQQQQFSALPALMAAEEVASPGFTYQFSVPSATDDASSIPFAVSPADSRYYDSILKNGAATNYEDDYFDMIGGGSVDRNQQLTGTSAIDDDSIVAAAAAAAGESSSAIVDGVPSYKLKAPMEVKPKNNVSAKIREDLKSMLNQLHRNGQDGAIVNSAGSVGYVQRSAGDVIKKHMEMDAAMGMYVVALIAGVSAAVTVGLIALGIGWYTLHKKGLAAADVEYPAYGVTGPNKDISPSGDRRLAQSAQMYHYQHQKQQIIAMENRSNHERNGGSLSDVESDDENEEGDYTVYECPGLAPTGEMEVKNPLFLDDPTPATPAAASTAATTSDNASQQQQSKQQPPAGGSHATTTTKQTKNKK